MAGDGASQAQHTSSPTTTEEPGAGMRVLAVDHGTSDEEALLTLAHADESDEAASGVGDLEDSHRLGDEKVMRLAEWVYHNVEEVWSGFNLLAEAVARGYTATPTSQDETEADRVTEWEERVRIQDKVRMWVKNALVYGRCVMEAGEDYLKVRNPRSMDLEQDEDGDLTEVTQRLDDEEDREVPVEDVHVFQLHSLFSDDLQGISAVRPVLQTLDDQVGVREVNRAIQSRYRAPVRIVEMPADATEDDRRSVQSQLEETPPDMDLVLPPGASVRVIGHGSDAVEVDELMKAHFTDRIFMGLGIPKIALGIPTDANRATSETQRKLLLKQKVEPYQRQVRQFAEALYHDVLDVEVQVSFDPIDARDEKMVAEVSRLLVEAGI